MDTKINMYILSTFLKQQNFLIILIVILVTNVLSIWRNLHLKSTTYEIDVENKTPYWQSDDVTSWTRHQRKICI